jgi:lysophospholipid acyltransferase (LPLAT)-like uncharacterized protein
MSLWLKRIGRQRWFQASLGTLAAGYLQLVWKTSRFRVEPPDIYESVELDLPVIIAMWHGQHFMVPFIKRAGHRAKALISRHRDGEINAIAAERLGIATIRGSGDPGLRYDRMGPPAPGEIRIAVYGARQGAPRRRRTLGLSAAASPSPP